MKEETIYNDAENRNPEVKNQNAAKDEKKFSTAQKAAMAGAGVAAGVGGGLAAKAAMSSDKPKVTPSTNVPKDENADEPQAEENEKIVSEEETSKEDATTEPETPKAEDAPKANMASTDSKVAEETPKSEEPVATEAEEPVATKAEEPVAAEAEEHAKAQAEEPVATEAEEPAKAQAEEVAATEAEEPAKAQAEEPVATEAEEPAKAQAEEVATDPTIAHSTTTTTTTSTTVTEGADGTVTTTTTTSTTTVEIDNVGADEIGEEVPVEVEDEEVHAAFTGELEVAEVSDDMTFAQAFAAAREQVGEGGVFEWHGKMYGTYYKDEWEALSDDERNEFYDNVREIETTEAPTEVEDIDKGYDDNEIYIRVEEVHDGVDLTGNGDFVDCAVLDVNGHEVIIVDVNEDGIADFVFADVDGDGMINIDEFHIIATENVEMPTEAGLEVHVSYDQPDDYDMGFDNGIDSSDMADYNNEAFDAI